MRLDSSQSATPKAATPKPGKEKEAPAGHQEHQPSMAKDHADLGGKEASHGEADQSIWTDVAHKAHTPHGALHAIEAGEHGLTAAARLVARTGPRAASAAAEAAHHGGHGHGVIGKLESGATKGLARVGAWLGQAVNRLPGGSKLMSGFKTVGGAASAAARATDAALDGTRVGHAVRMSGSGGRFLSQVGGRIPVVGAALGGVIAAVDIKDAVHTLKDPKASTKEKAIAGSLGLLSGASGILGVGALGVAGAAAVGLTAPVSVPLLLGAAAITGAGAFALSFFKKKDH